MLVPSEPPRLLPGRSAQSWTWRGGISLLAGVLSLITFPIASGLPGVVQIAVVLIFGTACAVAFASFILATGATTREVAAGYTTLDGRQYRHLWRLDPQSGAVLRPPEESKTT